jgi:ribosomal protein L3
MTSTHVTSRGLLGRKLGMTQVWDADNQIVPVTVVAADTKKYSEKNRQEKTKPMKVISKNTEDKKTKLDE